MGDGGERDGNGGGGAGGGKEEEAMSGENKVAGF